MNITPNNTLEGSRGLGLHATGNNIELNLVVSDDAAVWELVTPGLPSSEKGRRIIYEG